MKPKTRLIQPLNQSGQGLTEYIILLMLVAVFCITVVQSLGKTVRGKIQQAKDHINSDVSIYQR